MIARLRKDGYILFATLEGGKKKAIKVSAIYNRAVLSTVDLFALCVKSTVKLFI